MPKGCHEQIGKSDRYHRQTCNGNADKPIISLHGRTLMRAAYMYLTGLILVCRTRPRQQHRQSRDVGGQRAAAKAFAREGGQNVGENDCVPGCARGDLGANRHRSDSQSA